MSASTRRAICVSSSCSTSPEATWRSAASVTSSSFPSVLATSSAAARAERSLRSSRSRSLPARIRSRNSPSWLPIAASVGSRSGWAGRGLRQKNWTTPATSPASNSGKATELRNPARAAAEPAGTSGAPATSGTHSVTPVAQTRPGMPDPRMNVRSASPRSKASRSRSDPRQTRSSRSFVPPSSTRSSTATSQPSARPTASKIWSTAASASVASASTPATSLSSSARAVASVRSVTSRKTLTAYAISPDSPRTAKASTSDQRAVPESRSRTRIRTSGGCSP